MSAILKFPPQLRGAGPSSTAAEDAAELLAIQLAATAVARDAAGGHASAERELIRASGLLSFSIPKRFGGQDGDWPTLYRIVRRLAREDSALAHVFAFHHLQLATISLFGEEAQQDRLLSDTAARGLFWGNAFNRLDRRTLAVQQKGGWSLNGSKSYCSGSVGSDWITLTAWHEPTQSVLSGVVPTQSAGLTVEGDWDAFGQRQTDSGSIRFDNVFLPAADVLVQPGRPVTPPASLRSQLSQLILTNLYLGIAQGALEAAGRFQREEARPWFASGASSSTDDTYVQHRYGELSLDVRAARPLADEAAHVLDAALRQGADLTPEGRGEVAIAVAQAKVVAHRAVVRVTTEFFELTGARSTSSRYGFDRFWRNARVHTLHDPVDYKLRDLGRHFLTGQYPDPTPYS